MEQFWQTGKHALYVANKAVLCISGKFEKDYPHEDAER